MILKIDISKFGLFNEYAWETFLGKKETFRKLNIIYGRNYSGKTTLSRIFKCIEDAILHEDYPDCNFSMLLDNGDLITECNVGDFISEHKVRVYNTDFVRRNLSWLHKNDGSIEPFTILGAKNIELDKLISEIDEELGSEFSQTGLIHHHAVRTKDFAEKTKHHSKNAEALEEKLRKRANDHIKINSNLFLASPTKKSFTINDIKNEITVIQKDISSYGINPESVAEKLKLLKEVALDDVNPLPESKPRFTDNYNSCKEILLRRIKPTAAIAELINDSILQEWVRQGIDRHKDKRTTCGFCGGTINSSLWKKLDEHFSKESEQLRTDIKSKIDILEQSKKSLSEFLTLKKDQFYASLHIRFEAVLKEWNSVSKTYNESINELVKELKAREKDIFKERELPDIADVSESILNSIKDFNELVTEHNRKTDTLSKDQDETRKSLRYSDIADFISSINYTRESEEIENERMRLQKEFNDLTDLTTNISSILNRKSELESQAKNESRGAELINEHLSHFFGHNELKLKAEGETPNMRFCIQRDGKPASNLSEGECSLISFCYFIAKMEDELKDVHNKSKLLIYIDDPISSLDSNHIFFMYSLIESVIAKQKEYGQLFISTHNLDFLKYLKRLTIPKIKIDGKKVDDVQYFLIERKEKNQTVLKAAPEYIKKYITEFNYLFEQIYQCSIADTSTIAQHHQYNFGNNMRKFLEAYLFYKFPSHKMTPDEKLIKYFEEDSITTTLINRVINEYSHLGEQFERGMEPIDVDEISKISIAVMDRIKKNDPNQFDALMESIS
ncbi:AAA family ATPase [Pedobacter ginsengisoli]|uniref:AAA family ATPase n=1 Tax=Pedobacter ginsengisoli TaxID=363852 RepID=UPI00254CA716|nr:AAA family ATPase [Pedobacter ginsengisoli]